MRLIALLAALVTLVPQIALAAFETRASAAYVYDLTTQTVLYEKRADVPLPPASMSKLMTLNMLFEALGDGRIDLDTEFRVSSKAAAMGGSKMFLRDGERVTVENLISGIIVQSGNDACVTVAEGLAGSEAAFAKLMTQRAKALGMENSHFANASGWPDPGQRMSMRDLALLAKRLMTEFAEFYPHFRQESFTWDGITQRNRNPLLGLGIGADGLKTGHTSEAGYGLVGSASQGGRRIIFVITGLDSTQARAEEAEKVVSWAFRQFVQKTLVEDGAALGQAAVWMGDAPQVGLVAQGDLTVLLPALATDSVVAEITYDGPLQAPIAQGQKVADLVIRADGMADITRPLYAADAVGPGGIGVRLRAATQILLNRVLGAGGAAG